MIRTQSVALTNVAATDNRPAVTATTLNGARAGEQLLVEKLTLCVIFLARQYGGCVIKAPVAFRSNTRGNSLENVARLGDRKFDLRKHQAVLLEAEDQALVMIEKASRASIACVEFLRQTRQSVVNPKTLALLERIPAVINHVAELPRMLSDSHIAAKEVADELPAGMAVMIGGVPKGPVPNDPAG